MFNFGKLDKNIPKDKKDQLDKFVGGTKNMVVIIRKTPNSGKINIDKGYFNAPMTRDEKQSGHYMRKIVNLFCSQENINLPQCEISLLSPIGAENFGREEEVAFGRSAGKSAGSAAYLALLSALHQKPISKQVAATGAIAGSPKKGKINDQEINLEKGTNLPIQGLKEKISASYQKGINHFVLSKYNSSPNLLTEFYPGGK
jgi:hypothetical protein